MDGVKSIPNQPPPRPAGATAGQRHRVEFSFADFFQKFSSPIKSLDETQVIAIGIALVVILLTILFLTFRKKKSAGQYVLMVGLEEAGKTLLFSRLVYGKKILSFTSMKPNESPIRVTIDGSDQSQSSKSKTSIICDLPGYARLRSQYWDSFRSRARAIIFVLDASALAANCKEVGDFLYTVLADEATQRGRLPVLIACNKQDELKAKSSQVIKGQLEKELNAIRNTRGAALGATDEISGMGGSTQFNSETSLGNPDRDFKFDDLKSKISFADCSAESDNPKIQNLASIKKWIYQNI